MNAIIMAGGKGTRLLPLTKETPKPLVPLIDKPVLTYALELLKKAGITDVALTVGHMADKIEEYYGDGRKYGVSLTYFREETPLGTAGGVKRAQSFVDDAFVVLSGDAYTEIDVKRAIEYHLAKRSPLTVIAQPKEETTGLGVLETDFEYRITSFKEKPIDPRPGLVNTGMYVVNKPILNLIPDGFYDFGKDLLPRLTGKCHAYVDYAYWSDIGTLAGYYETNKYLARKMVPCT